MTQSGTAPCDGADTTSKHDRTLQTVAMIVAATFIAVGILGFVPGITTHFSNLKFAGHAHDGGMPKLLGIFHVSVLHNLVHLAFGIGLVMARTARGAATFLIGGGVVYAVVLIYGLLIDRNSSANFLPVNTADNVLHAGLAVAMIALGAGLWSARQHQVTPTVGHARTGPGETLTN